MKVDFIRFKTTDGVELQGWLSDEGSNTAVLHIHGMSGNGYENRFLDYMRNVFTDKSLSFFTIDTRGRGIISNFWQDGEVKLGGSCYEIFDESTHDVKGAINYLKSIGKTNIVLQGHSLGCAKVVNFVLNEDVSSITKVVLLAPTDMTNWAKIDSKHDEYISKAKQLLKRGKGEELVGAQCWPDKTPLSAQTYPSICEAGSSADIYGDREGGALLGRVELPMVIAYGDNDIGITEIDGTFENWLKRFEKIKNTNTKVELVKGADHGYSGYEEKLAESVVKFITS